MSQITDLLSRVKRAEQKKGVPPGLTATIDSSRRRPSGKRRVVLLGASVVSAVALGIFTLYVAGSLKKSRTAAVPGPDVQTAYTEPVRVEKSPVESRVSGKKAAPAPRAQKDGQARAALKAPLEVNKEIPAGGQATGAGPKTASEQKAPDAGGLAHERTGPGADLAAHELYLAGNYERAGEDARAIASYAKAIELAPGNYKAMNNIASILLRAGSTTEAVPHLKDSLAVRPGYVPALVNMGIALARQGQAAEAEAFFSKALSIEPASVPALLNMAVLHERGGKKELAAGYYGKLKSLGHPEGAAGLDRLR